ncbi:PadR family transcriptional regulator [Endozoicomonas elysicola]|uniref:PadR family transcriptional regulator n=1 Tax=Endozoicomonas elysicola TaxID=305900 RepID=A0A081K9P2_9GAMM|nr:PadR family transcriptional regulator [Endozoicomonas elysicola]KEI70868.1 PadR family transcriptional regulator [Endozoicomonas elysicola]
MKEKILRKLFLGFIQIHILRHANQEPFFGAWLIEHLNDHGYKISPGTIYPLLHKMEEEGLITKKVTVTDGRQRKYYHITLLGQEVLSEANGKIQELAKKMED